MNFYKAISKFLSYWGGMDCAVKLPFQRGWHTEHHLHLHWTFPRKLCPGQHLPEQEGDQGLWQQSTCKEATGAPRCAQQAPAFSHHLAVQSLVTGSAAPGTQEPLISSGWILLSFSSLRTLSRQFPSRCAPQAPNQNVCWEKGCRECLRATVLGCDGVSLFWQG